MFRTLIQAFGTLLMLASLWFVGDRISSELSGLANLDVSAFLISVLLMGVFIYSGSNFLLSSNWLGLISKYDSTADISFSLQWVYAKSQLAKYIPGNVAHIAGRHVLAKSAGVSHAALSIGALLELLGLSVAALIVSSLALPHAISIFDHDFGLGFLLALIPISAASFIYFHRLLPLLPFVDRDFAKTMLRGGASDSFLILLRYCLFFILGGVVLLVLTNTISDRPLGADAIVVSASFAISWTIGFFTPGAPSGIGVREAILVFILGTGLGLEHAALIAILFRLVTVFGDLLFTGLGWFRFARSS